VALPAFAGSAHRAAARLLLSAGQQSVDISCSPDPRQQTHSSGVRQANGTHHTDREAGGRTPDNVTKTLLRIAGSASKTPGTHK